MIRHCIGRPSEATFTRSRTHPEAASHFQERDCFPVTLPAPSSNQAESSPVISLYQSTSLVSLESKSPAPTTFPSSGKEQLADDNRGSQVTIPVSWQSNSVRSISIVASAPTIDENTCCPSNKNSLYEEARISALTWKSG